MSYYKSRKMAIITIDKMLSEGFSDVEIEYKISLMFGFGSKLIKERRELITQLKAAKKPKTKEK